MDFFESYQMIMHIRKSNRYYQLYKIVRNKESVIGYK